jgi:predicted phosphodiesterase
MKIICISDTHTYLDQITIPQGDMIIHAGDATFRGSIEEISKFNQDFKKLPHKYKIFVAGNHDILFEKNLGLAKSLLDKSIIYLQDEGTVINGFNIWGSPWQPEFGGWAFNLKRGDPLKEKWDLIPENTDILITHGPPKGYGDVVLEGDGDEWPFQDFGYKKITVGCRDLRNRVDLLPNLKLHVFGHIHSGNGQYKNAAGKLFVNASVCNEKYKPIQPIHIIEL